MPKLDNLGVLFQELRVEDSRCFDVVSQYKNNTILYNTFTCWRKYHFPFEHCCAKIPIPVIFSPLRLTQAGQE